MRALQLYHGGAAIVAALLLSGCGGGGGSAATPTANTGNGGGANGAVQEVANARGLTPGDILAAVKTYTPSGKHDDYIMFASGGHSGQVFVVGLPSMRLLRSIGVFRPEPWQGWGYGSTKSVLDEGKINGKSISWGDTHHPALSETNADYDGQWLFINDKANARVAVIDLRDFETKQIVKNPIAINDHGGTMVTPNTEYVIEGGQYGSPLGWSYAPISEYNKSYRGSVTLWKFDREKGRIDQSQSFALELPPYWQDLFDAGKGVSEGWIFGNSFNTELATGGLEDGNAPFEAGASQRDNDYMHIINLRKAEAVYKAGKFTRVKGFPVISLQTLIDEGILYFAPEPKSPHGVDVTPGGEYMVVSGKLDPHVTIYSFDKIQQAIADKNYTVDAYGVPILDFDSVMEAQVEVGLGPLHTQFDDKGYAYTSLFLDSAIARWTLGGPYADKHPEDPWTLVGTTSIHYNVGHLATVGGDTAHPGGKYLVSLDKWSVDRFFPTGPLLPQNFQLIDIDNTGEDMPLPYDMPMGVGEPHYAQIIKADMLQPWTVYPEIGWDPQTQTVDSTAPKSEADARVERNGSNVDVYMTAIRSHYKPEHVQIRQGDHVTWHITNIERAQDATHGFAIPGYDINLSLEPGETETFSFDADRPGTFSYYCTEFCSALHLEMTGYMLIQPIEK